MLKEGKDLEDSTTVEWKLILSGPVTAFVNVPVNDRFILDEGQTLIVVGTVFHSSDENTRYISIASIDGFNIDIGDEDSNVMGLQIDSRVENPLGKASRRDGNVPRIQISWEIADPVDDESLPLDYMLIVYAGIAVAAFILLLLCIVIIVCCCKRKSKGKKGNDIPMKSLEEKPQGASQISLITKNYEPLPATTFDPKWIIPYSELTIQEELGRGAYGVSQTTKEKEKRDFF
jgi:hypothetical protein